MAAPAARLPGIRFEAQAPPVLEALPRMDVAGFVGYAASGPLHTPVLVEDVGRFHDVFGQDLALAWDRERGELARAQLAPAVRAFFRNGGRRCWVVRVAQRPDPDAVPPPRTGARTNAFLIPGVLRRLPGRGLQAARARSRSAGSWSDGQSVVALGSWRPVTVRLGAGGYEASGVGAGELVRLEFPLSRLEGYFPVSAAAAAQAAPRAVRLGRGTWFEPQPPSTFPVDSAGAAPQPRWVARLAAQDRVVRFVEWSVQGGSFVLDLPARAARVVTPGSWLRLRFDWRRVGPRRHTLLLMADEVLAAAEAGGAGQGVTRVVSRRAWWTVGARAAAARVAAEVPAATVVELELRVRDEAGAAARLGGLGLVPGHPRHWAQLPTDDELFRPDDRPRVRPPLWDAADHPRFPLAGYRRDRGLFCIPLGVPALAGDTDYQGARIPRGSALRRDGLDSPSWQLFVDPELRDSSLATVLEDAFELRYQRPARRAGGRPGRRLLGLHALLDVEEISLLALPDAVDRAWARARQPAPRIAVPELWWVQSLPSDGPPLAWSAVPGATTYELQASGDWRFETDLRTTEHTRRTADAAWPEGPCAVPVWYRVRARGRLGVSPWSNTVVAEPDPLFAACAREPLPHPPVLQPPTLSGGDVLLAWSVASPAPDGYRLEISADPAFGQAVAIATTGPAWTGIPPAGGPTFFRVAGVRDGQTDPWSNTVWLPLRPLSLWRLLPFTAEELRGEIGPAGDDLLALHQVVLRFCAARSDVFAVLSVPGHVREDGLRAYRDRLAAALASEQGDRTLSFAALYHPWLLLRDDGGSVPAVRPAPPDGALLGTYARRTLRTGAWLAPANEAFAGVVGLVPALAPAAQLPLFQVQLGQVLDTAQGYLVLAAETLSADRDLREINVRRLLILLRRLALREGQEDVFLPHDARLRRLVRRRFEALLTDLFGRGAFAGASPDEAFQVVTDDSVNPPESVDQGRLIVELRVAPSLPMEFLVVRLLQGGSGALTVEAS